jgi:hypothetical protein
MTTDCGSTQLFYREVLYWKSLSHVNVVPFLGAADFPRPFSLVSHWMVNGNIIQFLKAHPTANPIFFVRAAVSPFRGVLEAKIFESSSSTWQMGWNICIQSALYTVILKA